MAASSYRSECEPVPPRPEEKSLYETCPYNSCHTKIHIFKIERHLENCREVYRNRKKLAGEQLQPLSCKYNYKHQILPPELSYHEERCIDRESVHDYQLLAELQMKTDSDEARLLAQRLQESFPRKEDCEKMYDGLYLDTFCGSEHFGAKIPLEDFGTPNMEKYQFRSRGEEAEKTEDKDDIIKESPSSRGVDVAKWVSESGRTVSSGSEQVSTRGGDASGSESSGAYYGSGPSKAKLLGAGGGRHGAPVAALESLGSSGSGSGSSYYGSEWEDLRSRMSCASTTSNSSVTTVKCDDVDDDGIDWTKDDNHPHFSWWASTSKPQKPMYRYPPGLTWSQRREFDKWNTEWMERIKHAKQMEQEQLASASNAPSREVPVYNPNYPPGVDPLNPRQYAAFLPESSTSSIASTSSKMSALDMSLIRDYKKEKSRTRLDPVDVYVQQRQREMREDSYVSDSSSSSDED